MPSVNKSRDQFLIFDLIMQISTLAYGIQLKLHPLLINQGTAKCIACRQLADFAGRREKSQEKKRKKKEKDEKEKKTRN